MNIQQKLRTVERERDKYKRMWINKNVMILNTVNCIIYK